MLLKEIYYNKIKNRKPYILEALIREAPHCKFVGEIPRDLHFLDGAVVDLGFENLGLSEDAFNKLSMAFVSDGLYIPGTTYKMRSLGVKAVIEFVHDEEVPKLVSLPKNWSDAVLVIGDDDFASYVGSLVRKDQV